MNWRLDNSDKWVNRSKIHPWNILARPEAHLWTLKIFMTEKKCRWGILGSAGIAQKIGNPFIMRKRRACRGKPWSGESTGFYWPMQCPSSTCKCTAGIGKLWGTFGSWRYWCNLFTLPTGLRPEWAQSCGSRKTFTVWKTRYKSQQVEEIVAACDRAGVQFADGVMFMHSDRLNKVREVIEDGTTIGNCVGSLHSVFAPRWIPNWEYSDA